MEQLVLFLIHIAFRFISGSQNAIYYNTANENKSDRNWTRLTFLAQYCLLCLTLVKSLSYTETLVHFWIVVITAVVAAFCLMEKENVLFSRKTYIVPSDLHLIESLTTATFLYLLMLSNFHFTLIIPSLYIGLVLHKMIINFGSGLPIFSEKTDYEDGKYFGIPSLGIKIRRTSFDIRILIIILSSLFGLSIHFLLPHYSNFSVLNILNFLL